MVIAQVAHLIELGISYKLGMLKPLGYPCRFSIEATNICNFKCTFCPQSDPQHAIRRPKGYMTAGDFYLLLNRVRKLVPSQKNISICLDGEPLLNKDFPDFIKITNDIGMYPRFSTNGKLLTPDIADLLVDKGAFLAAIDFTSDKEVFESIRGRKGDYDIVIDNIRYLISIASRHRHIKLEIVDISHFSNNGNISESLTKLESLFESPLPGNVKIWARDFHNFGGHIPIKNKGEYKLCPYPWTSLYVAWNGDVVPCCRDTAGRTVLGNVFERSIPEIWYGGRYLEIRKRLRDREPHLVAACKDCDLPWSSGSRRWDAQYILSSLMRR